MVIMTLIEILENREEALNVERVAELLGISKKKVYHLAAAGVLPAFRIGKAIRFDPQDLADWLRRRKPQGEEPGSGRPSRSSDAKSHRKGQEAGSPDPVWRGKVKSLETALALNSSGR